MGLDLESVGLGGSGCRRGNAARWPAQQVVIKPHVPRTDHSLIFSPSRPLLPELPPSLLPRSEPPTPRLRRPERFEEPRRLPPSPRSLLRTLNDYGHDCRKHNRAGRGRWVVKGESQRGVRSWARERQGGSRAFAGQTFREQRILLKLCRASCVACCGWSTGIRLARTLSRPSAHEDP